MPVAARYIFLTGLFLLSVANVALGTTEACLPAGEKKSLNKEGQSLENTLLSALFLVYLAINLWISKGPETSSCSDPHKYSLV